jgi:putative transposase
MPAHAVRRANNRTAVFFGDGDCRHYLDRRAPAVGEHGYAVHVYVLMTNYAHLLMTPTGISRSAPHTGTLREGRFKASLVQDEGYLLTCYRYIEMNPVRAQMMERPQDYRWSSYRANALGEDDPVVAPHPIYRSLGATGRARKAAYRGLFKTELDDEAIGDVRACLQTGTPLGNERFRARIEQALGVKVGHSRRGRPRKLAAESVSDGE